MDSKSPIRAAVATDECPGWKGFAFLQITAMTKHAMPASSLYVLDSLYRPSSIIINRLELRPRN
jgi:hypothetical protein